ncbi:hypothetical protein Z043_106303, partial [Scleropages formosus]
RRSIGRSDGPGPGGGCSPRVTPSSAGGSARCGGSEASAMASAVFEGTSLVNMFVKDCWVNGVRRLIVSRRGREEDFFEIRTEWSDRTILYLHRSSSDLGRLFKRLADSFPEDRGELLNEVERLLKNVINMPWKYSRSEVVLTFFERSPLDQVLKNDNVHKIQPCFQSPVKISEIMRSNGFCLANTETIVFDENLPQDKERPPSTDSAEHPFENSEEFLTAEPDNSDDDPEAYVTNLSYYHLVPFETDILE